MIVKKVYEFNDYKTYLAHVENVQFHFVRGFRSRLAEAAGCNNAFVSQVLNTSANFSLEQALKIAAFLKLKGDEERYFIFLIEHDRAGTKELKEKFREMMDELCEKHLNIKGRVKQQAALSPEAQATYYSQWYYAAIHMIVTIPHMRTVKVIAEALKLKSETVEKAVAFLLSTDLLVEKSSEFVAGPSYLHLDNDSPNISKHHTNWRLMAVHSLQHELKTDVHYSTVSTFSKKDAEHLRAKFVETVQNYVQTISESREETMYGFNLDFYKLIED